MKAMYFHGPYQATAVLGFHDVSPGMTFVLGPQAPYEADPGFFTAGVLYVVTAVAPGLPGQSTAIDAPVPWGDGTDVDTTTAPGDTVTFNQPMAYGSGIYTVSTAMLANAYRVS